MLRICVRYHPVQVFGDACSKDARAQGVNRFSMKSASVGTGLRSLKPALTLCQCSTVRRFDLASRARIPLLCALLKVLPVEKEVVPVDASTLEDGHLGIPFFQLC